MFEARRHRASWGSNETTLSYHPDAFRGTGIATIAAAKSRVDTDRDSVNWSTASLRVNLASFAFWAWCGLLSYPMIMQSDDVAVPLHAYGASPAIVICQALGLFLFMTSMFISRFGHFVSTIGRLSLPELGILSIIILSFSLHLHDNETSILVGIFYTVLILPAALTVSTLWTLPPEHLERTLTVAAVILCMFGICAIAILGWPVDRNVGSIQPNLFSAPLLVAFILSLFRPGAIGIVLRLLCLGMCALVSSRYALIGCLSAIILYEITYNPLGRAKILFLVISAIAAFILWPQIMNVLALNDSTRDLSSGFSGRDQRWYAAIDAISASPFGIGFKRAIGDEAGHNGYLKTILEFGVVGGGLIIFLLACDIVLAGVEALSSWEMSRQRRFACARFGGLAAVAIGGFFQPQLLSLGDSFTMLFLFLLFRPAPVVRADQAQPYDPRTAGARGTGSPADLPGAAT